MKKNHHKLSNIFQIAKGISYTQITQNTKIMICQIHGKLLKMHLLANSPTKPNPKPNCHDSLMILIGFIFIYFKCFWRFISCWLYKWWFFVCFLFLIFPHHTSQVLGSLEDERTFSDVSFLKNKLRNQLTEHLPLVTTMCTQKHYTLTSFLVKKLFRIGERANQSKVDMHRVYDSYRITYNANLFRVFFSTSWSIQISEQKQLIDS